MKNKTEIWLVRHGQTDWNVEGRLQGHADIELNEMGHQQAQAVAEYLASEDLKKSFHAIYSSDLARAHKTAHAIAKKINKPVLVDPRLKERSAGVFEGLTKKERLQKYPEYQHDLLEKRDLNVIVPGSGTETLEELQQRAIMALEDIARTHQGQRVIIVTHGFMLRVIYHWVMQRLENDPDYVRPENTHVCMLSVTDGVWTVEFWARGEHLDKK